MYYINITNAYKIILFAFSEMLGAIKSKGRQIDYICNVKEDEIISKRKKMTTLVDLDELYKKQSANYQQNHEYLIVSNILTKYNQYLQKMRVLWTNSKKDN